MLERTQSVSARLLSAVAPAIAMPITTIINNSIKSGTFPTMWKLAKVIPIHKKGATDNKGNYRPISVLNALTKILERHVHEACMHISWHETFYTAASQGSVLNTLVTRH